MYLIEVENKTKKELFYLAKENTCGFQERPPHLSKFLDETKFFIELTQAKYYYEDFKNIVKERDGTFSFLGLVRDALKNNVFEKNDVIEVRLIEVNFSSWIETSSVLVESKEIKVKKQTIE